MNLCDTLDQSVTPYSWTSLRVVIAKKAQLPNYYQAKAPYIILRILASCWIAIYARTFMVMDKNLILKEFRAQSKI